MVFKNPYNVQRPQILNTVDFNTIMYLPYYAATDQFASIMEVALNSITSFQDGAYPISSCSLSDAEVFSFAPYYPDYFKYRSCVNNGKCANSVVIN